ncbi:MAG: GGDEF domain-containing protein [Acholeplasmatales bacterium]|nr:GGDEF domain-containing protein [Acholeplasmatales bacterium]
MSKLKTENVLNAQVTLNNDFDIIASNREFLRFFDLIEAKGSFLDYLDDVDIERFTKFVKDFKIEYRTKSIPVTLDLLGVEVLVLLTVCDYSSDKISFEVENLEFANKVIDGVITTNKEYEILLSSFDSEFLVYNYTDDTIVLKNTKNLQPIYSCPLQLFSFFMSKRYDTDLDSDFTKEALEKIESDIENKCGGKRYTLLLKNKNYIVLTGYLIENDVNTQYLITVNMSNGLKESRSSYKETHDGLTGLLNKETIIDFAKQRINMLQSECSLVLLDIDKFKEYNDSFGHQYGDSVLINVAKALKNAVMQYGEVGRFGGDEFLCIINSCDEEIVRSVCRSIRLGVQWCLPIENPDIVVTCSMGIARFPLNGTTYEELFNIADKCLYIAKDKGRNCYIIYRPNIHDKKFKDFEQRNENIVSGKIYSDNAVIESRIMDLLFKNDNYKLALDVMYDYVGVSQITVYDSLLTPINKIGGTANIREELLKKNDYFKFLNKYDYFLVDNTNILDSIDKVRFNMYAMNNIGSTIEIVGRDNEGEINGMITYDIIKPAKTFDRSKLAFILAITRRIIEKL